MIINTPKNDWDAKNPNIFGNFVQPKPKLLASVSELTEYYNDCKVAFESWANSLENSARLNEQTFETTILPLEEAANNFPENSFFDQMVRNCALEIYKKTSSYNLSRTKISNLFGDST